MFVISPDGRNASWNVGVERLLGYHETEFVGRHTSEIFTPEDRAAGVPERELAFAAAQGEASDERWLLRKDGTRFWASGLTYRLLDGEGRLAGFGKVFRDLIYAKTDPNKTTPENEAFNQYFGRIGAANTRFTDEGVPGWRTDRGEVFIALGAPDESIETSPGTSGRVVRWTYLELPARAVLPG